MEERNGKGILRWILIILAVVLVLLICWKAGWILNGNKNHVSEQEKQEAIQEAVEEINSELQEAQSDWQDCCRPSGRKGRLFLISLRSNDSFTHSLIHTFTHNCINFESYFLTFTGQ